MKRLAIVILAVGLASATLGSCSNLTCGPNTIEKEGQCVAQTTPPGADCGPGTYYDLASGRCLNGLYSDAGGICSDNTTLVIDDAGNRFCVGSGGGNDCSKPLTCMAPSSSNVSLCGRVFNVEDTSPVGDAMMNIQFVFLEVFIFEPTQFISQGGGAPIVNPQPIYLDACGRFRAENMDGTLLGTGLVAVAVKDRRVSTGTQPNDYVLTGIASTFSPGQTINGMRAFALKHATDNAWSAAAGLPTGTFGSRGVWIPLYLAGNPLAPFPGTPVAGVQAAIKDAGGSIKVVHAMDDWYFTDTDPLSRLTVSASADRTGANGTALFTNVDGQVGGLQLGSGIGSEPASKCWPIDRMAAPPGAAFVQEKVAGTVMCQ